MAKNTGKSRIVLASFLELVIVLTTSYARHPATTSYSNATTVNVKSIGRSLAAGSEQLRGGHRFRTKQQAVCAMV